MGLDPAEKSFRTCCLAFTQTGVPQVLQFDIAGGQMLSQWAPSGGVGAMAVYGPPLIGVADVTPTHGANAAGVAEAFTATAGYKGQITRLHLYVDASSTATKAVVGVYADCNGHPGTLLVHSTIGGLTAGSWNYADVPATPVAVGRRYWIAILGPHGGGVLRFRDTAGGARAERSRQTNLTSLPAQWTPGAAFASAPVSAFGS
jgi:hypothetical protein